MTSINSNTGDNIFIEDIKSLLSQARSKTVTQVNTIMLNTYYEIGKRLLNRNKKERKLQSTEIIYWERFLQKKSRANTAILPELSKYEITDFAISLLDPLYSFNAYR